MPPSTRLIKIFCAVAAVTVIGGILIGTTDTGNDRVTLTADAAKRPFPPSDSPSNAPLPSHRPQEGGRLENRSPRLEDNLVHPAARTLVERAFAEGYKIQEPTLENRKSSVFQELFAQHCLDSSNPVPAYNRQECSKLSREIQSIIDGYWKDLKGKQISLYQSILIKELIDALNAVASGDHYNLIGYTQDTFSNLLCTAAKADVQFMTAYINDTKDVPNDADKESNARTLENKKNNVNTYCRQPT